MDEASRGGGGGEKELKKGKSTSSDVRKKRKGMDLRIA